jgi:hypothetical protein
LKPKFVLIDWTDAAHLPEGWFLKSEAFPDDTGPEYTYTGGWLIKKNRTFYWLAHTISENCIAGRNKIPRRMVKRLIDLDDVIKAQGVKW